MNQTKLILPGLLAIMLVLSGTVWAQDKDEIIEKSFDVSSGGTLYIDSDLGSIEVDAGSSDKVEARVIRRPDSWRDRDAERLLEDLKVELTQKGNDVYIEAHFEGGRRSGWNRNYGDIEVRFEVRVPDKYNVELMTAGGSISVGSLNGTVDVETSGGSLSFGEIDGPIRGRTSGGSISLKSCKGKADIKTSGGSLDIGDVDGDVDARTSGGSIKIDQARGNVIAHTSGGSISIEEATGSIDATTSGGSIHAELTQQPDGDCRLETSAGGITVYMAKGLKMDLDARSSWGRVDCDFSVSSSSSDEDSRLRGEINGGGPELKLRTSAGKIRIKEI